MSHYPHLAQRLFNVPLALLPDKAEIIMAALADRFGIAHLFHDRPAAAAKPIQVGTDWEGDPVYQLPYETVGAVAVVEVKGTLVQANGQNIRPVSGMTGYAGIRLAFLAALEDPDAKAIVLDIDSPGGEVAGCFDLTDLIYAARGRKPIWAILSENAFSAAYAIASAADRIIVPRTGGVGSVGVIRLHTDFSRALDKDGITVTLVKYGAQKGETFPVQPLSKGARDRLQASIDAVGDLFVATVARNRGLSPQAVRDTEAGCFFGADGVAVGFADAVMAPDAAFAELLARL